MAKLSIVIPAYNEGAHIYDVVKTALGARREVCARTGLHEVEVVAVNDGSQDQTLDELERLRAEYPELRVAIHPQNRGYGAALKTGFEASSGDYVSFMDGDGTIDPRSFVPLYLELKDKGADMAIGRRFGEAGSGMPLIRKIGNHFFARLLSFLSGKSVKDTASGVRVFHKDFIPLTKTLPDGLHFTPAMSAKAVHENLRVVEVPIQYAERSGESKLRVVGDGFRFLNIILSTVLMYNPFKVFLLVGLLFVLAAIGLIAHPLTLKLSGNAIPFSDYIYRSIGALYLFVAGFQVILFGILARFMVSTFFKRHETSPWIHRLNDTLKVYDRMSWYGGAVFVVGFSINIGYFAQYMLGKLNLHWAWLMMAAGFILIGVQMVITGVVMRILAKIQRELAHASP